MNAVSGLKNPGKHCYINSALMLITRIMRMITIGDGMINKKTPEGNLVNILMTKGLINFKHGLSDYNPFFNGTEINDAYICFLKILNIIHIGTRTIDTDESPIKTLFLYTYYTQKSCCKIETVDTINISPTLKIANVRRLLQDNEQVWRVVDPPKILVLKVNWFDKSMPNKKNTNRIAIDQFFSWNCTYRYKLIGVIYHHGDTLKSDTNHFTSKIIYEDVAYSIDDERVMLDKFNLADFEISGTVYVLLYQLLKT